MLLINEEWVNSLSSYQLHLFLILRTLIQNTDILLYLAQCTNEIYKTIILFFKKTTGIFTQIKWTWFHDFIVNSNDMMELRKACHWRQERSINQDQSINQSREREDSQYNRQTEKDSQYNRQKEKDSQ